LLKITIVIVVGSFAAMLYLINSDKHLADFWKANESYDFTHYAVHPLFLHMQQRYLSDMPNIKKKIQKGINTKKFKNQRRKPKNPEGKSTAQMDQEGVVVPPVNSSQLTNET